VAETVVEMGVVRAALTLLHQVWGGCGEMEMVRTDLMLLLQVQTRPGHEGLK